MCIAHIYTQRERTMLNHFFAHSSQCGKYENEQTNAVSKERTATAMLNDDATFRLCSGISFHSYEFQHCSTRFIRWAFNQFGSYIVCDALLPFCVYESKRKTTRNSSIFMLFVCCLSLFKVKWKFVLSFWINVLRMNFFFGWSYNMYIVG